MVSPGNSLYPKLDFEESRFEITCNFSSLGNLLKERRRE